MESFRVRVGLSDFRHPNAYLGHPPSLIVTSNRGPSDWYLLFPDPVIAESLLDRLIDASHQAISNSPSYSPNKPPENHTDKPVKPPT
ncbi:MULTISPECIES: hypothetical protein [Streptomyces]|uniref:Uncharacterized protein n=1 Tax=Streptomyces lienomycini TaxID=284035 RepID=A0ABV9X4R2_9ACTN|nr:MULTISPECIES: hypothetical protein [Streptomyces]